MFFKFRDIVWFPALGNCRESVGVNLRLLFGPGELPALVRWDLEFRDCRVLS